jgi:hypothetical protein
MKNSAVAVGTGPSAFVPNSNVTAAQAIVTGFSIVDGLGQPGVAFGSDYANGLGNRMTFALAVFGNAPRSQVRLTG